MNISITSRKFKAHDSLKEYINSELSLLKKYNDNIMNADVVLSYQNNKDSIKETEVILQVPGQILKASSESDDFKKSISMTVEKLIRQLKKVKTKKLERVR